MRRRKTKLKRSRPSAQRTSQRSTQNAPSKNARSAGRNKTTGPDLIRDLQGSIGNRAVDEMIQRHELGESANQSRLAVQRQEPKEGSVGGGSESDSGAGGGATYTIKSKDIKVGKLETEFVDIVPHGTVELKVAVAGDAKGGEDGGNLTTLATKNRKNPESATQLRAGGTSSGGGGGVGVDAELKHDWEDTRLPGILSSFHPAAKLGGEANEKEAKVAFEASLEGHDIKPTAELALVKGEWDEGDVKVLTADVGADVELASYEYTSGGGKATVTPTVKLRLEFGPNWSNFGKWMARQFGETAVEALLGTGGLVLGGLVTIGVFLLTLNDGDKEAELINTGIRRMNSFVRGFVAEATGEFRGERDDDEWNGHLHGMKWVEEGVKKMPANVPYPNLAVMAAAKDLESSTLALTTKAQEEIRPQLRADMTQAYWEYHYVMKRLSGGVLPTPFRMAMDMALNAEKSG